MLAWLLGIDVLQSLPPFSLSLRLSLLEALSQPNLLLNAAFLGAIRLYGIRLRLLLHVSVKYDAGLTSRARIPQTVESAAVPWLGIDPDRAAVEVKEAPAECARCAKKATYVTAAMILNMV